MQKVNLNLNFGVSTLLQKFYPFDKESKIEEGFYDSTMKLIEADHDKQSGRNGMVFKYSQINRQIKEEKWSRFILILEVN